MWYRKKPVEVAAVQFHGQDDVESLRFTDNGVEWDEARDCYVLWVDANQAWVPIEEGEWLVRDARGVYPCKPDIFEATYEPVGGRSR